MRPRSEYMPPLAVRSAVIRLGLGSALLLATWLFLAAMPVLADGGPHVASQNSGSAGLTADGCAGCHRAHTAQGQFLLAAPSEEALCLNCHGTTSTGATTNVEDGVQYTLANAGSGQPVAGALRAGGFVNARVDSAHSSRKSFPYFMGSGYVTSFSSKVGALAAGAAVTSSHLDIDGPAGVALQGIAWGNGADGSGTGPAVSLSCVDCHNPHGNGQYRILVPVPNPTGTGFVAVSALQPATVTDATLPVGAGAAGTRNYTIQDGRTLADVITAAAGATAGDYWRRYLPWDGVPGWDGADSTPATGHAGDVPMYVAGAGDNLEGFRNEIRGWCLACHTRYFAGVSGATNPSGDADFQYRHVTTRVECTQCHVAHGSNAAMTGTFSAVFPYPNDVPAGTRNLSASSRLLKIDNRGTCQACHDPTGTIPFDGAVIAH
jgi:predicted CXXCH cytochrome family protein